MSSKSESKSDPKAPEGKAGASLNALKHGLFARDAVLPEEDRGQFLELLQALEAEHQPVGPMEEFFVQQLAAAQWRLRRLGRIETGLLFYRMEEIGEFEYKFRRQSPEDRGGPGAPGPEYDETTRLLGEVFWRNAQGDALAKLSRYEMMVRRACYRALHNLQFCQARRAGQPRRTSPSDPRSMGYAEMRKPTHSAIIESRTPLRERQSLWRIKLMRPQASTPGSKTNSIRSTSTTAPPSTRAGKKCLNPAAVQARNHPNPRPPRRPLHRP